MSSNTLGALLLAAVVCFIVGSIVYTRQLAESCRPNEVLARGVLGLVCVQGHRP